MSKIVQWDRDGILESPGTAEPNTHLTLLGGVGIRQVDREMAALPTRKARLLLAYLASPADRMHQRGKLVGLLWGDRPEEQARGSLRNALSALRKILGPDALTVEGDGVALRSSSVDIDVARFEARVVEGSLASVREAVSIYAGDFLDGVAADQPAYQEWMLHEQLRFRGLARAAFRALAALELREQAFGPALEAALRLLELDPLDEQSHRIVMRLYAASGQRSMAMRQFEACRGMLADELGVKPAEETEQLFQDVQKLGPEAFCDLAPAGGSPIPGGADDNIGTRIPTRDDIPAVAVLPFNNPGGDPKQEFFADGLTEDIITALTAWRSFRVLARNSSFSYKNMAVPVSRVAEELGARYVLEGSVRKGGGRLRITARLNDAVTGDQVWAEKFDRDMTDMFALQDEMAQRIAAVVEPEIDHVEQRRAASKKPSSLAAWEWFQRGMYLIYKFTKPEIEEARGMFRHALELDPDYARAQIGLAYCHQLEILHEFTASREDSIAGLLEHARRGAVLDDADSMAHVMTAFAYRWAGQHDMAVAEGHRAVELNPNDAWALATLGNVLDLAGSSRDGIPHLEKSLLLSPHDNHNHFIMAILARAHLNIREYQKAADWAREAIRRNPGQARAYLYLAVSLGHLGNRVEARAALDDCERVQPGFAGKWSRWREYRNDADNDHFSEGLRSAGLQET